MYKPVIADLGSVFGMGCNDVFEPWSATVIEPSSFKEYLKFLPSVDIVVFGGGEDIHPSLYNHVNIESNVGKTPSYRDNFEYEAFHAALEAEKFIFGICRGAQLVCALSGGSLIQNVYGHSNGFSGHEIMTIDNQFFMTTSAHHQMMFPNLVKHELLAWAANLGKGKYSYDTNMIKVPNTFGTKEPELVYFPDTKSLAVQGHPEWMKPDSGYVQYLRKILEEKMNAKTS